MSGTAPGRRTVVWISVAVVFIMIIAVVLVASGTGGLSGTSSRPTSSTGSTTTVSTCAGSSTSQTITIISGPVVVGASGKVAVGVTCPDGHLGTILRYNYGDPIRIMVTVPDSLTPIAIQTVYDGNPNNSPGTPTPWDVKSTGHTYILDYGPAGESTLTVGGTHNVYAIVTFSDNSTATSNVVYFTVNAPSPQK
jgi:hypothetical protein